MDSPARRCGVEDLRPSSCESGEGGDSFLQSFAKEQNRVRASNAQEGSSSTVTAGEQGSCASDGPATSADLDRFLNCDEHDFLGLEGLDLPERGELGSLAEDEILLYGDRAGSLRQRYRLAQDCGKNSRLSQPGSNHDPASAGTFSSLDSLGLWSRQHAGSVGLWQQNAGSLSLWQLEDGSLSLEHSLSQLQRQAASLAPAGSGSWDWQRLAEPASINGATSQAAAGDFCFASIPSHMAHWFVPGAAPQQLPQQAQAGSSTAGLPSTSGIPAFQVYSEPPPTSPSDPFIAAPAMSAPPPGSLPNPFLPATVQSSNSIPHEAWPRPKPNTTGSPLQPPADPSQSQALSLDLLPSISLGIAAATAGGPANVDSPLALAECGSFSLGLHVPMSQAPLGSSPSAAALFTPLFVTRPTRSSRFAGPQGVLGTAVASQPSAAGPANAAGPAVVSMGWPTVAAASAAATSPPAWQDHASMPMPAQVSFAAAMPAGPVHLPLRQGPGFAASPFAQAAAAQAAGQPTVPSNAAASAPGNWGVPSPCFQTSHSGPMRSRQRGVQISIGFPYFQDPELVTPTQMQMPRRLSAPVAGESPRAATAPLASLRHHPYWQPALAQRAQRALHQVELPSLGQQERTLARAAFASLMPRRISAPAVAQPHAVQWQQREPAYAQTLHCERKDSAPIMHSLSPGYFQLQRGCQEPGQPPKPVVAATRPRTPHVQLSADHPDAWGQLQGFDLQVPAHRHSASAPELLQGAYDFQAGAFQGQMPHRSSAPPVKLLHDGDFCQPPASNPAALLMPRRLSAPAAELSTAQRTAYPEPLSSGLPQPEVLLTRRLSDPYGGRLRNPFQQQILTARNFLMKYYEREKQQRQQEQQGRDASQREPQQAHQAHQEQAGRDASQREPEQAQQTQAQCEGQLWDRTCFKCAQQPAGPPLSHAQPPAAGDKLLSRDNRDPPSSAPTPCLGSGDKQAAEGQPWQRPSLPARIKRDDTSPCSQRQGSAKVHGEPPQRAQTPTPYSSGLAASSTPRLPRVSSNSAIGTLDLAVSSQQQLFHSLIQRADQQALLKELAENSASEESRDSALELGPANEAGNGRRAGPAAVAWAIPYQTLDIAEREMATARLIKTRMARTTRPVPPPAPWQTTL